MKTVIDWAQSFTRTVQSAVSSPTTETTQSSLFLCSSCDSVYIATEKQTCSTCGTPVRQVRATLDNT